MRRRSLDVIGLLHEAVYEVWQHMDLGVTPGWLFRPPIRRTT
jgi:hypothetical protein